MKNFVLSLCVFLAVSFLAFFPCVKVVSISNRKNLSESIYSKEALKGFSISYTHSVNKGRIQDFYVCGEDGFVLEKTIFVSYGAGIPEPDEIANCEFEISNNGYVLKNINRQLNSFLLAVGVVAEHSITMEDNEYFLKNFFPPQTSLLFEIRRLPVIAYFRSAILEHRML